MLCARVQKETEYKHFEKGILIGISYFKQLGGE